MTKTHWIILAIIIIVLAIWGFARDSGPEAQGEPIRIGGLFALSGYASFAGEASRDGFIMAIEDSGLDIDYVIEDFQSSQKSLLTAVSKLLDIDGVSVVIGPEWSEFGELAAPIADEKKIPFISTWMDQESEWLKDNKYYFSATPSGRWEHRKVLEYMVKNGETDIVVVYSNNAWSLSNLELFKDEVAKNNSINIIGEFKSGENETDFRTDLSKINQLKPDAIYSILSAGGLHGIFSKQMQDLGFNYSIYSTDSRAEDSVIKENFYKYVIGQLYTKTKGSEKDQEFREKYKRRFEYYPGAITAATAYDATTIVLNAIKSGANDPEEIREYLENIKDYNGYSNTITFNTFGQVEKGQAIIKQIGKDGYIVVEE